MAPGRSWQRIDEAYYYSRAVTIRMDGCWLTTVFKKGPPPCSITANVKEGISSCSSGSSVLLSNRFLVLSPPDDDDGNIIFPLNPAPAFLIGRIARRIYTCAQGCFVGGDEDDKGPLQEKNY